MTTALIRDLHPQEKLSGPRSCNRVFPSVRARARACVLQCVLPCVLACVRACARACVRACVRARVPAFVLPFRPFFRACCAKKRHAIFAMNFRVGEI